ncbi:response regulator transcription factor [Jeotgalibacillus sp. S-D1]|uniref:LytR/AlgR family response regulator transcription factor n=1 Tax=Jeotgalibacillus sp. S-D1 TaxID=2552189 RepID=UPI001059AD11|nr:LytTR family DNA-binding domain-containing protein [Jeotgalibacillus sp. S-D1]TDL32806.1 response regulator transcription factor [Jeotgalibacillus sp. S-D1]
MVSEKHEGLSIEMDKLIIEQKKKVYFIKLNTITYIERELRQSYILTEDGQSYRTYQSLKQIESLLPKEIFFRTHKSCIVNLHKIKEIEHYSNSTYIVKFNAKKQTAYITRERLKTMLQCLSKNLLTGAATS